MMWGLGGNHANWEDGEGQGGVAGKVEILENSFTGLHVLWLFSDLYDESGNQANWEDKRGG